MPLRDTELRFVDGETITCPRCSQSRPATNRSCPNCGSAEMLERLNPHTSNFQITSLFRVMTVVAICLAIARFELTCGVVAGIFSGLTMLTTAMLIRERKRHRYPVSTRETANIFLRSAGHVFVGMISLFVLTCATGFVAGILGIVLFPGSGLSLSRVILGISMGIVWWIVGVWSMKRHPTTALIGGGLGILGGVLSQFAQATGVIPRVINVILQVTMAVAMPVVIFVTPIAMCCWHGGNHRAKAWLAGIALGLIMVGVFTQSSRIDAEAGFFVSLLLLPCLITIMIMERIMHWSDALPSVSGYIRSPEPNCSTSTSYGVIEIADDEDSGENDMHENDMHENDGRENDGRESGAGS